MELTFVLVVFKANVIHMFTLSKQKSSRYMFTRFTGFAKPPHVLNQLEEPDGAGSLAKMHHLKTANIYFSQILSSFYEIYFEQHMSSMNY